MDFRYLLGIGIICCCIIGCQESKPTELPFIGQHQYIDGDTILHKIRPFSFVSQDSVEITNSSLANHIYVTDFFFMSCPSTCPKVKKQMLRLYDRYEEDELVKLVSHTMDPKRDHVKALNTYAHNLGVTSDKWLFLTGEKDLLLDINNDYFIAAFEDAEAPGGFDHSGKIVLVDKQGHVRAFAEGTDPDDVTEFFDDIDLLLKEYAEKK